MCGIAGSLAIGREAAPVDLASIERMVAAVRHRGPDEFGLYRDRSVALGHARLSIIDLASGQQPMTDQSGTLWIVFNGEIFNYVELRAELAGLGNRFLTRSDTEVVLVAYREWGERAFERFNGQFALALWDASSETLVLARDRFGVRPLFMAEWAGRLWFASEVKALFAADPGLPRRFDPVGLSETFTFWATVAPQTVFEGVSELPPGTVRTITRTATRDHVIAQPLFPVHGQGEFEGSLGDAADAVRRALEAGVELRMLRADVPVGCYVSGGLDSSIVCALASRAVGGRRFSTFAIRFEDPEYDETSYQREVASALGTNHHELVARYRDIAEVFPDVIRGAERPLLRTGAAAMHLLSRVVRDAGIKVVLTGEGADEVFAGYDLFREARIRRFWGRQPDSLMRPALLARLYPYLSRSPVAARHIATEFFGQDRERWAEPGFSHAVRWRSAASLQRLFRAEVREALQSCDVRARLLDGLPPEFPGWSFLAQDQYIEIRTLLTGYVLASQGDRMLMANSVEGRFPFLDPGVNSVAERLPPRFKLSGLNEKAVLKKAAEGIVPERIIRRTKQPFRAPDGISFVSPDRPDWVDEVLSDRAILDAGVFDPRGVQQLWRKCRMHTRAEDFSNADNMALVGVLSTGLLHQQLIRETPTPAPVHYTTVVDRLVQSGPGAIHRTREGVSS